jgi:hypothetical protein
MVDPFAKPSKKKRFFKVLKTIFLTKIPMNLLFLLIIIALSIFGFESITSNGKNETPTGYAVLEQECPECVCEEKETDCSLCPVKTKVETQNVIYYKCPQGALVKDLSECMDQLPDVPEEYSGTVEGITLAIDNIELEKDEETTGFVTGVEYTIINKGEFPIVPKIQVKVYEDWTLKAKKAPANKVLSPEIVVSPNDYVKRQDRVRIYFRGEEQTLRLLLIDSLTDPDTEILAVTRDFELD